MAYNAFGFVGIDYSGYDYPDIGKGYSSFQQSRWRTDEVYVFRFTVKPSGRLLQGWHTSGAIYQPLVEAYLKTLEDGSTWFVGGRRQDVIAVASSPLNKDGEAIVEILLGFDSVSLPDSLKRAKQTLDEMTFYVDKEYPGTVLSKPRYLYLDKDNLAAKERTEEWLRATRIWRSKFYIDSLKGPRGSDPDFKNLPLGYTDQGRRYEGYWTGSALNPGAELPSKPKTSIASTGSGEAGRTGTTATTLSVEEQKALARAQLAQGLKLKEEEDQKRLLIGVGAAALAVGAVFYIYKSRKA